MTDIDPNIQAAHGDNPEFTQWLGFTFPPEVQQRGIKDVGQWRDPNPRVDAGDGFPDAIGWRTCGYCGGIHPEDLIGYLERGEAGDPSMADMKYGFPHKLYVDLPNPLASQMTVRGQSSWREKDGAIKTVLSPPSPEPATWSGKFYTLHLRGLPPEPFQRLADWIESSTGIHFEQREEGLWWKRVATAPPRRFGSGRFG